MTYQVGIIKRKKLHLGRKGPSWWLRIYSLWGVVLDGHAVGEVAPPHARTMDLAGILK
jgi:hypothetical protein